MSHGSEEIHQLIVDSGWSYPVSVNRIEREHALANIDIDEKGNTMMVAELFSETDVDRFESQEDLERKLDAVFEQIRQDRKPGLFERIKRTFLGY